MQIIPQSLQFYCCSLIMQSLQPSMHSVCLPRNTITSKKEVRYPLQVCQHFLFSCKDAAGKRQYATSYHGRCSPCPAYCYLFVIKYLSIHPFFSFASAHWATLRIAEVLDPICIRSIWNHHLSAGLSFFYTFSGGICCKALKDASRRALTLKK